MSSGHSHGAPIFGGASPRPPLIVRGPLTFPAPIDYATRIPDAGMPPPSPNKRWWRGNFWSIEIPGALGVPGGNANPDLIAGPLLHAYPQSYWPTIFRGHLGRNYSHYLLWWPNARAAGWTPQQYTQLLQSVQSAGLYSAVAWFSKDYDPSNQPWEVLHESLKPVFDVALGAGAVDIAIIGLEIDSMYQQRPDLLQGVIDGMAGIFGPLQIPLYIHFYPEHTWWGPDGGNRFQFWGQQVGKLTGLCYQTVAQWDPNLMQGHIADTRLQFAQPGYPFDMVVLENQAIRVLEEGASEYLCDLMGYLSLCGDGGAPVMGFGNGARWPDGTAI